MGMENLLRPSARRSQHFSRSSWAEEEVKTAIGFHVTVRLADDGGLARTPIDLRVGSEIMLRHGEERGLVVHRIADTHGHAGLVCTREEAGIFANCVEGAMRKRLDIDVPFQRCRIRPIANERHLGNLLPYCFRQESHHGTSFDLLHDGSSLPELLGMRMGSPWLRPRVLALLPRIDRSTMLSWLGVPELDAEPLDIQYLAEAAAAAWGVGNLDSISRKHTRARCAAVQMLDRLAPRTSSSKALGIPARSAVRYRREEVSSAELRAVEMQMKMRGVLDRRRAAAEAPGMLDPRH
jgi:hypothetical protein